MHTHSPIYQKAFGRYLRTGISIETQLQIGEQKALDDFRTGVGNLAKALVTNHIEVLRHKFVAHGRSFPEKVSLNIAVLEREFVACYAAIYTTLSIKSAPEKDRVDAYNFLQTWFAQKIDPILQPHYGVVAFIWEGNSSRPCANCAAKNGKVFRWDEGIFPPGCGHCKCKTTPVFELGEEVDGANTPSAQEMLSVSWRFNYKKKSDIKWMNMINKGGWTKEKVSRTIREGEASPAPNEINRKLGHAATSYKLNNAEVVVDNKTKEVIYLSRPNHIPKTLE